jgi:hypothetical protein
MMAIAACSADRGHEPLTLAYRRQALNDLILFRARARLIPPIDGCGVFNMLDRDSNYLERLGTGQKALIAKRDPSECINDAVFFSGDRLVVQEISRTKGGLSVVGLVVGPGYSHKETYFLREIDSGNRGTPSFSVESMSWGEFANSDDFIPDSSALPPARSTQARRTLPGPETSQRR